MDKESELIQRFVPVTIHSKKLISHLGKEMQSAIFEMIEASKYANNIFLEQVSHDGVGAIEKVEKELQESKKSGNETQQKLLERRLHLLHLFAGPYGKPDGVNFLPGETGTIPPEAGFYPKGTTKEDIDKYVAAHPERKEDILAIDTVVERDGENDFKAIKFSERYERWVTPLCNHLDKAAEILRITEPEFSHFIEARSHALRTNTNLYDTDIEWMRLPSKCPVDLVIGPIETYEDQIEGMKGSYQSIVFVRADNEMQKLEEFKKLMNKMERNIPLKEEYLREKRVDGPLAGASSSASSGSSEPETRIELYNVVYLGGDAAAPTYVVAHNLPNDERITSRFGNRNQFYLNILQTKAEKILVPISNVVIGEAFRKYVSYDGFFMHVLMHELSHTLGPSFVRNDGVTTIKSALQDLYSTIEECKADVLSSIFAKCIVDGRLYRSDGCKEGEGEAKKEENSKERQKLITEEELKSIHVTSLASMFRSIRFGHESAHAKGCIIQLNWLIAHGAAKPGPSGFEVDFAKCDEAFWLLGKELLEIKVEGDRDRAERLLKEYGTDLPDYAQHYLDLLRPLPIDLAVSFDLD